MDRSFPKDKSTPLPHEVSPVESASRSSASSVWPAKAGSEASGDISCETCDPGYGASISLSSDGEDSAFEHESMLSRRQQKLINFASAEKTTELQPLPSCRDAILEAMVDFDIHAVKPEAK